MRRFVIHGARGQDVGGPGKGYMVCVWHVDRRGDEVARSLSPCEGGGAANIFTVGMGGKRLHRCTAAVALQSTPMMHAAKVAQAHGKRSSLVPMSQLRRPPLLKNLQSPPSPPEPREVHPAVNPPPRPYTHTLNTNALPPRDHLHTCITPPLHPTRLNAFDPIPFQPHSNPPSSDRCPQNVASRLVRRGQSRARWRMPPQPLRLRCSRRGHTSSTLSRAQQEPWGLDLDLDSGGEGSRGVRHRHKAEAGAKCKMDAK